MSTRRGFLALLGLAPAVALAPKAMLDSGKVTDFGHSHPIIEPPVFSGNMAQTPRPMRYLGLVQLKNEGDITGFDVVGPYCDDEIRRRFAKEDAS
jgi:hypothetical protein